jgi:hypothetical protein
MTPQDSELHEILAVLRREHQKISLPASAEERLRTAISTSRIAPRSRWVRALALASIVVLVSWTAGRSVRVNSVRHRSRVPLTQTSSGAEDAVVSDFIALPSAELLPAPREVRVWRVRIARGELAQYGFNVPPTKAADLIYADFAVGEDGLPREIRFVR